MNKILRPLALHPRSFILLLLCLSASFLLFFKLSEAPPIWFDEGWGLTVARNWVELGHFAQLLDGKLVPQTMLSRGTPAVVPYALSFRLFGVGVWQGRLAGAIVVSAAMALLYDLAGKLYNRSVAIATLAVLLLMSAHPHIHPLLIGRQAVGESPALLYLLAGYAFFLSAWRKPLLFLPFAILLWGLALITKPQVLPFFTASLLVPLAVALYEQRRHAARRLAAGLLGTLVASQLLGWIEAKWIVGYQISLLNAIPGLIGVTAFVPLLSVRLDTLQTIWQLAIPTACGLCYAAWRLLNRQPETAQDTPQGVVRMALWALVGSWFGWYALLSIGWVRYLYPITFIGSLFTAALLHDLTGGFRFPTVQSSKLKVQSLNRGSSLEPSSFNFELLTSLAFWQEVGGALLAVALVVSAVPGTVQALEDAYGRDADSSLIQVTTFLNTQTPPNALIESYDGELFFLLNRRYHYPPDRVQIEGNRNAFLNQNVPIDYDPLAADPDYLVVGQLSKLWHVYDPILKSGQFRLIQSYKLYDLYERVR